jgi:hypothetical protein
MCRTDGGLTGLLRPSGRLTVPMSAAKRTGPFLGDNVGRFYHSPPDTFITHFDIDI